MIVTTLQNIFINFTFCCTLQYKHHVHMLSIRFRLNMVTQSCQCVSRQQNPKDEDVMACYHTYFHHIFINLNHHCRVQFPMSIVQEIYKMSFLLHMMTSKLHQLTFTLEIYYCPMHMKHGELQGPIAPNLMGLPPHYVNVVRKHTDQSSCSADLILIETWIPSYITPIWRLELWVKEFMHNSNLQSSQ